MSTRPSAVLFDFFGTLVRYEPDRSRLDYPESFRLARSLGYRGDHRRFVDEWDHASLTLESDSALSHVEYSMTDAAMAFAGHVGLSVDLHAAAELGAVFVGEWQRHVVPVAGVEVILARLAEHQRLGVVSNTHDPAMVPAMLDAIGVADLFSVVVLSVDHGFRKPHPTIYFVCPGQPWGSSGSGALRR